MCQVKTLLQTSFLLREYVKGHIISLKGDE